MRADYTRTKTMAVDIREVAIGESAMGNLQKENLRREIYKREKCWGQQIIEDQT